MNVTLYQKLLVKFANQYQRGFDAHQSDLQSVIHTLKGSAANLGLTEIAKQAAAIELASKEAAPELAQLQAMTRQLAIICSDIKRRLPLD
ncbi:Hpt domain-containing protein [Neiella marina]|uniref:Hpt domain-containing protein n=1 Tax=Neiella holothuriorum TaxID=2870530 RepID=A0ABS7EJW5_9GAMM|nr:Hpt domain-containing protein [Neiella holothuriorum]MBW8192648.1 Hpt domain-containing protein [Neiella holothuriorum]